MKKRIIHALALCALGLVLYGMTRPFLFGQTAEGYLFIEPVRSRTEVTLHYRHSVERTPIWEYLEVNSETNGLVLRSTKYQSFGAGLPFAAWQGRFRREGDWFFLEDINRPYPTLSIRNGVSNHEVVTVGKKTFILDDSMPLGGELYMYVAPLYQALWLRKEIRR